MTVLKDISAPVGRSHAMENRKKGIRDTNRIADKRTVADLLAAIPAAQRGNVAAPKFTDNANRFTVAVEAFQQTVFGFATGRMDPGEMTVIGMNRMALAASGGDPMTIPGPQHFDARVMAQFKAIMLDDLRPEVIRQAAAQIGNIRNLPSEPGSTRKIGADLLWRIHAETMKVPPRGEKADIERVGKKPFSWCGVYAIWAVKNALKAKGVQGTIAWHQGDGVYRDGHRLLPEAVKGPEDLGLGDICIVDEKDQNGRLLYHHIMVDEIRPGASFKSLEGNTFDPARGANQCIVRKSRRFKEVMYAYRLESFLDPVVM